MHGWALEYQSYLMVKGAVSSMALTIDKIFKTETAPIQINHLTRQVRFAVSPVSIQLGMESCFNILQLLI